MDAALGLIELRPRGDMAALGAEAVLRPRLLAIVDKSRLRRECLRFALAKYGPDWQIVEAASVQDLPQLSARGFDLVLIGAATSEHVDLRQIEDLRNAAPETSIVVVADSDNAARIRQILGAGARGFLPASLSLKVMIGALDLVLAGGVYVPSSLIDGSGELPAPDRQGRRNETFAELTHRQCAVLALIAQGKPNKAIADALAISESTVKAHVKQIIKRLNVANRTQAALLASSRDHGEASPRL
jgi:DNA-binding NarL/FixJ family response regulator